MNLNEYDGSQKAIFLSLVEQRIKYLEELSVKLPKEIELRQLDLKTTGEELSKLYQIIPRLPKVLEKVDYSKWGENRNA